MISLAERAVPRVSSRSTSWRTTLSTPNGTTRLETIIPWLLTVFVFAMPTDPHPFGGISVTLPVGSLCILLGMLDIVKRRSTIVLSAGWWCLLVFVIWSTCSLTWVEYPNSTTFKIVKDWEYLALAFVITQYAWNGRIRTRLLDAYVAGCWYGVLGTFFNYATGRVFVIEGVEEAGDRYSFGVDVNYLGLALVIGIMIAWYRVSSERVRWRRLPYLIYIPAAVAAVGLTGSRGGLLALLGGVITYAIFAEPRRRIAMFAGAVVLVIVTLSLPASITWRLFTTTEEISHGTLDGRKALWNHGSKLFEESPIIGVGVGGVEGSLTNTQFNAVHNTPLEFLAEGGIVGFALFYGGLLHSMYRVKKVAGPEGTALVAVCMAWFIGTFSISWDIHMITWFVVAILLSAGSAQGIRLVSNAAGSIRDAGPEGPTALSATCLRT